MRVAFYAPLKPPDAATPSGDRRMARLLVTALETAGHEVAVAAILRARDGGGNATRQARLAETGMKLAARLVRRWQARPERDRPEAWFTYHLYYKAPDWIGPAVADALSIPYVVAEASHAPKRAGGAWAIGHEAAAAAIRRADALIGFNPLDSACLRPLLTAPDRLVEIPPFLDAAPFAQVKDIRAALAARHGLDTAQPWAATVAMMRTGAKLESYRLLAAALARLGGRKWQLLAIGDGPARSEVEAAFAGIPPGRIAWLGEQAEAALPAILSACDLCLWPAINEAYGMALLEAQAAGLPAVAGNSPGVAAIVADGGTGLLTAAGDAAAFADAAARLLNDAAERATMGAAARAKVARVHGIGAAAAALDAVLTAAKERRAA
ncbi:MAG: glycosyltransferase [Alphaproteobacteria bacterium]|nr:glycosyltransferase [Alphaproteobacteria bacterium]